METLTTGSDAATAASHFVMICILGLMLVRVLTSEGRIIRQAANRGLVLAFSLLCCGLLVERAYYFAARLLKVHGVDLWNMHPVPEVLSLMLAAAIYGAMIPFMVVTRGPVEARRTVCLEGAVFVVLWFLIAAWLQ